jgi:DNA-binding protein YbaB
MNLEELLSAAERTQGRIEAARARAADLSAEGAAGGGRVVAVASGAGELRALRIDPALLERGEGARLEALVVEATNLALHRALELARAELGRAMDGPLLFGAGPA